MCEVSRSYLILLSSTFLYLIMFPPLALLFSPIFFFQALLLERAHLEALSLRSLLYAPYHLAPTLPQNFLIPNLNLPISHPPPKAVLPELADLEGAPEFAEAV